jgi:hypothetical protein
MNDYMGSPILLRVRKIICTWYKFPQDILTVRKMYPTKNIKMNILRLRK